jgi:hypothetical protein
MADELFPTQAICTLCNRTAHDTPWVFKYKMECPGSTATEEDAVLFKQELVWRDEVNGRFGNDVASDPELSDSLLHRRDAALYRQAHVEKRLVPTQAIISADQVSHVDAVTGETVKRQEIADVLAEPAEFEVSVPHLEVPGEVPIPKTPLVPFHADSKTKHQNTDYLLYLGEQPE